MFYSHDNTLFLVPSAVTSGIWDAAIVPALLPQYAISYFTPSRSVAGDMSVGTGVVNLVMNATYC